MRWLTTRTYVEHACDRAHLQCIYAKDDVNTFACKNQGQHFYSNPMGGVMDAGRCDPSWDGWRVKAS
jgi:hypothetical protein